MSKLTDRASYLKGLAEGMKLNPEKETHRLLLELVDLVNDMTKDVDTIVEAHNELNDYVESIDDDLADLEEALFDDEEDEEEDDEEYEEDEDASLLDDDAPIEYACPHCGHVLQFRAADVDFNEDYLCPECGKSVFPEIEEDEEDESDEGDEE